MQVMIWGTEERSCFVHRCLRTEHNFLGYIVESEGEAGECRSAAEDTVFCLTDLCTLQFDIMILTSGQRKESERIKEIAVRQFQCPENKIIDFYELFTVQRVDGVMLKNRLVSYDGMILGLSHAFYAVNPMFLQGKWCNLAGPSQDLYYNLCIFKHCLKRYQKNVENIKYVLIDLYDYINFNWDVSLSRMILYYYSCGGYFQDLHHYSSNANFPDHVYDGMKQHGYYAPCLHGAGSEHMRSILFDEEKVMEGMHRVYGKPAHGFFCDCPEAELVKSHIKENTPVEEGFFETPLFMKKFELTIKNNCGYFEELLQTILGFNPAIRIYAVLIPRYNTYEKMEAKLPHMQKWKSEFEKKMDIFCAKYPLTYLDLKNLHEISDKHEFYYDGCHLNFSGSKKFTGILNDMIFP